VLTANLAGAHLFAWAAACTHAFHPEAQRAFDAMGREAMMVTSGDAMLRGIFAGWLIALVVWLNAAYESGKLAIIVILTYFVGLAKLTHVVAGSTEVLYLVMKGELSWLSSMSGYILPSLLGNIIGGVTLVSALNHAQVSPGRGAKAQPA
jgi:formate/nitrite transporter FocA (FNT family)